MRYVSYLQKTSRYDVLRVLIAAILLLAAGLKTYALIHGADKSFSTFHLPIWLVYQGVVVEYILGLWLLAGVFAREAWIGSIVCFAIFLCVSTFSAFSGETVCGCFGYFSTSPWIVSFLDFSVLVALFYIRPAPAGSPRANAMDWSQYQILARTGSFLLVVLSASILFAYGLIAHKGIERYDEQVNPQTASATTNPQNEFQTVPIFLSAAGLAPPFQLSTDLSVEANFASITQRRKLVYPVATSLPGVTAIESLNKEQLIDPPMLLEGDQGEIYLLLGVISDMGKLHYQLIQGGRRPFLAAKSTVDSSPLKKTWHINEQDGEGVTFSFGRALLHIDKLYHNFGKVRPYDNKSTQFMVTNTGSTSVAIVDTPKTSCGCTVAEFEKDRVLQPGQSMPLKIVVETDQENMRNSITALFEDSETNERLEVVMEVFGIQIKSMVISPGKLDFGVVQQGDRVIRTLTISEQVSDRFRVKETHVGDLPLEHSLTARQNSNGLNNYYLKFVLDTDGMSSGSYEEKITIATDSRFVPKVEMPIIFRIPSDVTFRPRTLDFGVVTQHAAREKVARLVAPDCAKRPVCITSVPTDFSASVRLAGSGIYEIVVKVTAKRPGPKTGTVHLALESESGSNSLKLECAAYVEAPDS